MKNYIFPISIFLVNFFAPTYMAYAQVAVDVSAGNVHVQTGKGGGAVAVNQSGVIDADDIDIEGVAIINNKVFIDGQEVPRGKTIFVSKKTKKRYVINWNKNGSVAVSEK